MAAMAKRMLASLFGLGLLLILLIAAEAVTRIVSEESRLDTILALLERDSLLFWRNRAELELTFLGEEVVTNATGLRRASTETRELPPKRAGIPRVLCLGASPTFGWGLAYEESYPAALEALSRQGSRKELEVINAGMIGYSSHQGRRLLAGELLALEADVVTVSYVVNDVDRYRFYRNEGVPDRALVDEAPWRVALQNLMGRSRLLRRLSGIASLARGQRDRLDGRPVELMRPRGRRVPIEDYKANLTAIAAVARAAGSQVVFVKMPVNLPVGAPVSPPDAAAAREHCDEARDLLDQGQARQALEILDRALSKHPYLSAAHYYRGLAHAALGDEDTSSRAYDEAMKSEGLRCGRDGVDYNAAMAAVAAEQKVPLVDAVADFDAAGQGSRDAFFLVPDGDPIHPNAKGHARIARLLLAALAGL